MALFLELVDGAYIESAKLAAQHSQDTSLVETCTKLVTDNKLKELYNALSVHGSTIVAKETSQESVESFFLVLSSIIFRILDIQEQTSLLTNLQQILVSSNEQASRRLKLLINFLNSLDHRLPLHFDTFSKVLKYAVDNKLESELAQYSLSLDKLVTEWNLSDEQRREVESLWAKILIQSNKLEDALQVLMKHLKSLDKVTDEVLETASQAAVIAIKSPKVYVFDELCEIPAVSQLGKVENYQKLYELLQVFLKGKYEDYLSFYEKNKDTLTTFGLSHEDNIKKMRLLTLCSLAVPGTPLSYDSIISGLKIEKNEVEKWVIEGVARNIVNLKIDQQKSQVNVIKTTHRELTKEKWEEIDKKLAQWKNSVETVLKQLQEKKKEDKKEEKTE